MGIRLDVAVTDVFIHTCVFLFVVVKTCNCANVKAWTWTAKAWIPQCTTKAWTWTTKAWTWTLKHIKMNIVNLKYGLKRIHSLVDDHQLRSQQVCGHSQRLHCRPLCCNVCEDKEGVHVLCHVTATRGRSQVHAVQRCSSLQGRLAGNVSQAFATRLS